MCDLCRARDLLEGVEGLQALVEAVEESKGLHTHGYVKSPKIAFRRARTQKASKAVKTAAWRFRQKDAQTTAGRAYRKVQAVFRKEMRAAVLPFLRGRKDKKTMKKQAKAAFEKAYRAAYRLGLKAAGVADLDIAPKMGMPPTRRPEIKTDKADDTWVKGSLKDERQYWNGFMRDVVARSFRRFSPEERIDMYVDTLDHTFNAARVVGQPHFALIYWVLNPKKETCDLCYFLQEHSPYTRETLPGVPRDGDTCKGLSRCGCELRITVPPNTKKWNSTKRKSRAWLMRQLKRLREGKGAAKTYTPQKPAKKRQAIARQKRRKPARVKRKIR